MKDVDKNDGFIVKYITLRFFAGSLAPYALPNFDGLNPTAYLEVTGDDDDFISHGHGRERREV